MALGVGIIGYGGMGGWHRRYIETVEGMKVVAIHDIDPKRVEAARAEGLRAYSQLSEFLNDQEIDVAVIAVPNDAHMELSIAASTAGKHVVCEKPVALSSFQLEAMIETARRHNRVFTVHQNRRWDRDFRRVKATIEQGLIGTPYVIESRIHGPNGAIHGWRSKKEHGGGMMLDWGVHLIDQLLWMIPTPIKQVNCTMRKLLGYDVDDYLRLQIEFADGLLAYVEIGLLCLTPLPRWYVGGSEGTLVIDKINGQGVIRVLKQAAIHADGPLVDTGAGPTKTFGKVHTTEVVEVPAPEVESDWLDFYRNLKAAIAGTEQQIVRHDEIRRVLKVMEAGFESAESGMPVRFDS